MLRLAKWLCCIVIGITPGLLLNGCAFTPHQEDMGQVIEDTQVLKDRVRANLYANPETRCLCVAVFVFRDVVTLRGRVNSLAQKQLALAIAKQTPGVAAVRDELIVRKK
jgi:hyperosmotically inducible protein